MSRRLLFWSIVVVSMGQMLVFAVLPPLGRDLDLSELEVALLLSASSVTLVVASPRWGRVSDRRGRRPVLLVGLYGYALGTLLFVGVAALGLEAAISGALLLALLLVTRVVQSYLVAAAGPAATAYAVDISEPGQRLAEMSRLSAALTLGRVVGPAITAVTGAIGLLAPFCAGAVAAAALALLVQRRLPESHGGRAGPVTTLRLLDRRYLYFVVATTVAYMAVAMLAFTLGFFFQDVLEYGARETAQASGVALAASAGVAICVQLSLGRWWRWSPLVAIAAGLSLICAGLLVLGVAASFPPTLAGMSVCGLGMGLAMPAFFAGATLRVNADEQGAIAGLMSACPAIGYAVGPPLAGVLYGLGPRVPFFVAVVALLPLVAAAVRGLGARSPRVA